jgi:signal transduction histidine kinase
LHLETVSGDEKVALDIDWNDFEAAQYISDVPILIKTEKTAESNGTTLSICGGISSFLDWNKVQFDNLVKELKKLIIPKPQLPADKDEEAFEIYLKIEGFGDADVENSKIEPFPLFELYDYSISGVVNKDGFGFLVYSQQNIRNSIEERIEFNYGEPLLCGNVGFDIKVFDRESSAIEALIKRGLKTSDGNYLGKLEAKQLLNTYNGIGVYRNDFRIRPLGEPNYDWLKLNEMRIQNPSMRVGYNQVMGAVHIESEEESNLIEKSARDGLKENDSYRCLVKLTQNVLVELEKRRFSYRVKAGLSRTAKKVGKQIESLFSLDGLKKDIETSLKKGNVAPMIASNILEKVDKAEKEKSEAVEAIQEILAQYQGEATLGRMINVLMHEGRKPLSFFKNQIPLIKDDIAEYERTNDHAFLDSIFSIVPEISFNSEMLVTLFNKLNPLAVKRNSKKTDVLLLATISEFFRIYENEMQDISHSIDISTGKEFYFNCRKQDLYCIFVNLIENSIYWITEKNSKIKNISIFIKIENNNISYIDYKDSGPGIEKNLADDQTIFEPGFSTKPGGSGLGLSIAGEAAERCGFDLVAYGVDEGAYFQLQNKG